MTDKNAKELIEKSLCNIQKFSSALLIISNYFDIAQKKKDNLDIGEKESIKEFLSETELYEEFIDYQKSFKSLFREEVFLGNISRDLYLKWDHELSKSKLYFKTCIIQTENFKNIEISEEEKYSHTPLEIAVKKFNLRNENKFYIPFNYREFANYKEDEENGLE